MKKHIILSLLVCLALCLCMRTTWAATGDEEAFTTEFLDQANQRELRRDGWGSSAFLNDTFYQCGGNVVVYSWSPGETALTTRYTLPPLPGFDTEGATPTGEQEAMLQEVVTNLVPIDGELWALNMRYGRFGKITEQGVAWEDVSLDTSLIDEYAWLEYPYVEDGKLYAQHNPIWFDVGETRSEMVILQFDLSTGAARRIETNQADFFTPYKPGSVLLLHGSRTATPTLSVMELATGAIEPLPVAIPEEAKTTEAKEEREQRLGGVAYDLPSDTICFYAKSKVWRSMAGASFEAVADLPLEYMGLTSQAWMLSDCRYGMQNGGAFYVRNIE